MAESLGGPGQRVAGASPHTLKIWDYINEHPGVTRDELKAKALELDWIARGYAHRFYANSRNRKFKSEGSALELSVTDVAATRSDVAVRAVVTQTTLMMLRDGAIRRDDEGGYHAVRRPRATGQVEARVRPRDEVMAGIAAEQARRKLRAYGVDRLRTPAARLPLDIRETLARWVEATELVEVDPTNEG